MLRSPIVAGQPERENGIPGLFSVVPARDLNLRRIWQERGRWEVLHQFLRLHQRTPIVSVPPSDLVTLASLLHIRRAVLF